MQSTPFQDHTIADILSMGAVHVVELSHSFASAQFVGPMGCAVRVLWRLATHTMGEDLPVSAEADMLLPELNAHGQLSLSKTFKLVQWRQAHMPTSFDMLVLDARTHIDAMLGSQGASRWKDVQHTIALLHAAGAYADHRLYVDFQEYTYSNHDMTSVFVISAEDRTPVPLPAYYYDAFPYAALQAYLGNTFIPVSSMQRIRNHASPWETCSFCVPDVLGVDTLSAHNTCTLLARMQAAGFPILDAMQAAQQHRLTACA